MWQNYMDISTRRIEPGFPLVLANKPLSPWLRLAHIADYPASTATHQAQLRLLHDFEIVLPLEGATWIYCHELGTSVDIQVGEVAFIPPGFVHGWGNEPGQHLAVHFDLHARPEMQAYQRVYQMIQRMDAMPVYRTPGDRVPCFSLALDPADASENHDNLQIGGGNGLTIPLVTPLRHTQAWRDKLIPLSHSWNQRSHRSLAERLRFAETIAWALRTVSEDAQSAYTGAAPPTEPAIVQLLRELEADSSATPNIGKLARRAGMGQTAFRQAFLRVTGRSPRAYLEERRIARVERQLIESDRKISDIARSAGYQDPFHFSRVFKRVTGVSPREYRSRGSE